MGYPIPKWTYQVIKLSSLMWRSSWYFCPCDLLSSNMAGKANLRNIGGFQLGFSIAMFDYRQVDKGSKGSLKVMMHRCKWRSTMGSHGQVWWESVRHCVYQPPEPVDALWNHSNDPMTWNADNVMGVMSRRDGHPEHHSRNFVTIQIIQMIQVWHVSLYFWYDFNFDISPVSMYCPGCSQARSRRWWGRFLPPW